MAELTPMKKQYREIKEQHADCLLFFRLGDFYEMFEEDAHIAARELDLALTTRDRGKPEEDQAPMCGVPYHSAEAYISRLIAKGYKVAVCEQTEDPLLAKGLVRRDVIRVISPGTVIESSMLEDGVSNYLAAVFLAAGVGSAAFCDVSTGEVCLASFASPAAGHLQNELARFRPREVLLSSGAAEEETLRDFLEKKLECRTESDEARFDFQAGSAQICRQYGISSPEELGLGDAAAVCALGGLLSYLADTPKSELRQLRRPDVITRDRYMELDNATRRNLELTENLRTGEKKGSLLWVLDKTRTPMGGRLLRAWTERPLLSPVAIRRRLAAVDELFRDSVGRAELMRLLRRSGISSAF
jgi:DNA mismatch repair protein MutS